MQRSIALGVIAALALGAQAYAADGEAAGGISYDYLEANYVTADIDGAGGNDPDGFSVNGSLAFTPMVHGYVDYTNLEYSGTTVQGFEVGVGLNHALNSTFDLVGRLGYVKTEIEGPFDGDDGFGVQAGVRGQPMENFEFDALVHYTDVDSGDNTSLKLQGRWFFVPQFSLGAGVELDDDVRVWNVGFRWNFR